MTFKEKHILPLMLSAAMVMGCSENKPSIFNEKTVDNDGLLDERPQKDVDKFNSEVLLYQVDIPVYTSSGERIKGQFVLSRGLKNSSYTSAQRVDDLSVKPVFLNGSDKLTYVKADIGGAIYTERGYVGLFIDYNKRAVVVADRNISQFITNMENKNISQNGRNEQNRYTENRNENTDITVKLIVRQDTIATDSVKTEIERKDTLQTDSVFKKDTYTETQFLDTLRSMKQKEITR